MKLVTLSEFLSSAKIATNGMMLIFAARKLERNQKNQTTLISLLTFTKSCKAETPQGVAGN